MFLSLNLSTHSLIHAVSFWFQRKREMCFSSMMSQEGLENVANQASACCCPLLGN